MIQSRSKRTKVSAKQFAAEYLNEQTDLALINWKDFIGAWRNQLTDRDVSLIQKQLDAFAARMKKVVAKSIQEEK